MRTPLLFAALISAACGSSSSQECILEPENPQAAPVLVNPASGNLDVVPDQLSIEVLPPPASAGAHVGTAFEIWRVAGGEPVVLAWRAETSEPSLLLSVAISDGEFEGLSQTLGLIDWRDYAVRARYRLASEQCAASGDNFTGNGGCCDEWSAWSEPRVFRVTDYSPEIFDEEQIRDMALEIGPESFDAINAEARPPGCVPFNRNYYTGNAIIDGERFDGVGIRAKGGCGSSRNLNGKTSFKVHLAWNDPAIAGCPETRRHRGLKRFTFNNLVQDRSFTHERVAYSFYELMGVPVPRVAHVRLSVNGEPWGLYLNVETIDRRMLSRNFGSPDGALYEGTYFCDLVPGNVPPGLENDYCIQAKFVADECSSPNPGADPLNYDPIRALTAAIEAIPDGAFYPAITDLIEWDNYVSLWAADAVINHWDGYTFDIINNYRIYHDLASGKWTIIPTGVDQTLTQQEVNPFGPSGLLARRCLAEPACETVFAARLAEAADIFEQADLGAFAANVAAQIRSEVEADPRKEGDMQQFDGQQAALQSFIANRPQAIRNYLSNRSRSKAP